MSGDGKPDLVGLNTNSGDIAVLLNTGASFAAPAMYSAGMQYTLVFALGDVTGDGRPDLVATNTGGTVSVLANTGAGNFAARITYSAPVAFGLALADMNEDGKLDVVVGAHTTTMPTVAVLLNQGGGVLGAPTHFPVGTFGESPRALAAADLNGDGHIDIASAYTLEERSSVLLGTGTGQLGMRIDLAVGYTNGVALSDLDLDGRTDLVLLHGTISPYLNTSTAAIFDVRERHQLAGLTQMRGARMADLDGDGRLDLLAMGDNSPTTSILATRLATGNGAFAPEVATYATPSSEDRIVVTDLDNDSRPDFVLAGYNGIALMNQGTGALAAGSMFAVPQRVTNVGVGDMNGDGRRDLVVTDLDSGLTGSNVSFLAGLGNGDFAPAVVIRSVEFVYGAGVLDVDGDGTLDIVVDEYTGSIRRTVLRGLGDGTFVPVQSAVVPRGYQLAVRDVNADGKSDLIGIVGHDNGEVGVILGNGTTTLASPIVTPARAGYDTAFADLDGDGHLDIVVSSTTVVGILRGRGDGTFTEPEYYDSGYRPRAITTGDVDGDGRVDILVDNDVDVVSILRGRCL